MNGGAKPDDRSKMDVDSSAAQPDSNDSPSPANDSDPSLPNPPDTIGQNLGGTLDGFFSVAPSDKTTPVQQSASTDELTSLGEYELLDKLGQGGMGVVYRAKQRKVDRIVALKRILPGALVYTSGVTGPSRGVVLTHGSLVQQSEAVQALGL